MESDLPGANMECKVRNGLTEEYLRSQFKLELAEKSWQNSGQVIPPPLPTAVALARKNVIDRRSDLIDHCRKHGC
jgi:hypothetical protein